MIRSDALLRTITIRSPARQLGMLSSSLLQLRVNADGSTEYAFTSKKTPQQSVYLRRDPLKGVGSFATKASTPGTLYNETSAAVCVVGANEQYVCKGCLTKITKAKVRADCPRLTFCSHECLARASDYLDCVGEVECADELALLAVNFLYSCANYRTAAEQAAARRVMRLETHAGTGVGAGAGAGAGAEARAGAGAEAGADRGDEAADKLLLQLKNSGCELLLGVLEELGRDLGGVGGVGGVGGSGGGGGGSSCSGSGRGSGPSSSSPTHTLRTLLRVIRFNAQPLPFYSVKGVQLLGLFPSAARVNHSCIPNCMLAYRVPEVGGVDGGGDGSGDGGGDGGGSGGGGSGSGINSSSSVYDSSSSTNGSSDHSPLPAITLSLLLLTPAPPDAELTMSYLQPLCAHHQLRGELLQAFRFECTCTRCMGERQSEEGAGEGAGEVVRVLQRLLEGMDAGGASARVGELLLRADSVTAESEARTGSGTGTGDGPLWAFGSSTSVAHDAASVALQVSLAALGGQNQGKLGQPGKQGKQGQGPGQGQWEHLHYAVRAGLILSRCWHLSGCGLLLQRAEFVISCGGFALQLSASPHSPSHSHSSPSVLVCAAKEDLQTVAYSLDNLSIYLNQGTATATATGTAAYIQLLLTRARALLKQL